MSKRGATKRPFCREKASYRSLEQAKQALRTIRWHGDDRGGRPHRAYRCEACRRWHLTSQP